MADQTRRTQLVDRLMAFRRHQEFGTLREVLREAAEQISADAQLAGDSLTVDQVLEWFEAREVKLLPWQIQKLNGLE